jgi:hypothetical protein
MSKILLVVLASLAASAVSAAPAVRVRYPTIKPEAKSFAAQEQVKSDPNTCPFKQARDAHRKSPARVQASISDYLRSGVAKTEVPRIRYSRSAK